MAWSAAMAVLPTVIENMSTIIKSIDELSARHFTPKNDLKDQNTKLNSILNDLKVSFGKIGISIRDYEAIYTATIQEEVTASDLANTFSIWQAGQQAPNDPSMQNGFKSLKDLDVNLGSIVNNYKEEVEREDLEEINALRTDIQAIFFKLETHLNTNTEFSLNACCQDVGDIRFKIGQISSLLNRRFNAMSRTLIDGSYSIKK